MINNNTYQCYSEDKKVYSVLNIEEETKRTFNTPSKKIECFLGNLSKKAVDPMPTWRKDEHVNVPAEKFKFITGRHAQHTQSSTQNNVMLLDIMGENYA